MAQRLFSLAFFALGRETNWQMHSFCTGLAGSLRDYSRLFRCAMNKLEFYYPNVKLVTFLFVHFSFFFSFSFLKLVERFDLWDCGRSAADSDGRNARLSYNVIEFRLSPPPIDGTFLHTTNKCWSRVISSFSRFYFCDFYRESSLFLFARESLVVSFFCLVFCPREFSFSIRYQLNNLKFWIYEIMFPFQR